MNVNICRGGVVVGGEGGALKIDFCNIARKINTFSSIKGQRVSLFPFVESLLLMSIIIHCDHSLAQL